LGFYSVVEGVNCWENVVIRHWKLSSEERVSSLAQSRRWKRKIISILERKCRQREAFKMVRIINWAFLEFFAYNGLVAQSVASLLPVMLVRDDPGSNPVDGREE